MEKKKIIQAPVIQAELDSLKAGDTVYLTGIIYTGRDAAHMRLTDFLKEKKPLPIELMNQVIYYVGPCPAKPGQVIGSCGPTSSYRMDAYTPALLDLGLKIMIGKGPRSREVVASIKKNRAVYLAGIGGAGALMAACVKTARLIGFADLGAEAIYRLQVENLPLIVAIDTEGNDLYEIGPAQFREPGFILKA
jgi:fumarate hydratase subunit beta